MQEKRKSSEEITVEIKQSPSFSSRDILNNLIQIFDLFYKN